MALLREDVIGLLTTFDPRSLVVDVKSNYHMSHSLAYLPFQCLLMCEITRNVVDGSANAALPRRHPQPSKGFNGSFKFTSIDAISAHHR